MDEHDGLAEQFEANRPHLRAVAYRMLGSVAEADDAVQEAWLRLSRTDSSDVVNLGGWLTTVVARVSLDMLRTRKSRREDSLDMRQTDPVISRAGKSDPEEEAVLADAVGLALLVVLDTLAPAERLAFVLHDMFAVPFEEIAPIVGRSPTAVRQLASRARRRVRGAGMASDADRSRQWAAVDAFLAASRGGDFETLVALLDPDVVFRADRRLVRAGAAQEVRGASAVAAQFVGRAQAARPTLINGAVGIVVAPRGRLTMVLDVTFTRGKIAAIEAIADPARLRELALAVLDT